MLPDVNGARNTIFCDDRLPGSLDSTRFTTSQPDLFIYLFVVLNRTWGSVTGVGPEIGESNTVGKSKYRNVQRKGRAIAKR